MSFKIEQPRCLARLRAKCSLDEPAVGEPGSTRAKETTRAKRSWWRLTRRNRPQTEAGPAGSSAAGLSNLISLNQSIVYIMVLATPNLSPQAEARRPKQAGTSNPENSGGLTLRPSSRLVSSFGRRPWGFFALWALT